MPIEQAPSAGQTENLRADRMRHDAAVVACIDLELDPALVLRDVSRPACEVAGDREAVRFGEQIDRARSSPAVRATMQARDEREQAASRIVIDERACLGGDDRIDFAIEYARGKDINGRQQQRNAGGEDQDEQRGKPCRGQAHA